MNSAERHQLQAMKACLAYIGHVTGLKAAITWQMDEVELRLRARIDSRLPNVTRPDQLLIRTDPTTRETTLVFVAYNPGLCHREDIVNLMKGFAGTDWDDLSERYDHKELVLIGHDHSVTALHHQWASLVSESGLHPQDVSFYTLDQLNRCVEPSKSSKSSLANALKHEVNF